MTTIEKLAAAAHGSVGFDRPLAISLRRADDAPELARRPLRDSELYDLRSDFWLEMYPRRGMMDVPLEAVSLRVTAETSTALPGRCQGFVVEASGPDGQQSRREYGGIQLFSDAAAMLAQELVAQGQLKASDTYAWRIVADAVRREMEPPPAFSLSTSVAPLSYITRPVGPLLQAAETVGQIDEQSLKVFYVRRALERIEKFARRGAEQQPPVETGAVQLGTLVSCPETDDLYVVVTDALELADAEQQQFSLTYTGATWTRLRAIVKARQSQPGGQSLRMLGQAHGHNFLPAGGAPPCEACATAKVCGRTSVFVSTDDRAWTRAVMSGQPWQMCHIFGFNARQEYVSELYGLHDNQLVARGYYAIDEFGM